MAMKGKEDALHNYMKSISRRVTTISNKPIMRNGVCIGVCVDGVLITKELYHKNETRPPNPPAPR
jgi:hypothetical protein